MLLDAIADHVRAGLTGLHLSGYTTGAIGVGYRRRELPNGPVTNRGFPRTVPEVDPEVAALIRKHARLHLDGMSLKEGWRRWLAAGDNRKEVLSRIRSAQSERAAAQLNLARLKKTLEGSTSTLCPDDVRRILADMSTLLQDAAAGKLGDEAVYKALAIFRRLTGGRIWVHVERRKGRKRTNVRGVFRPHLIRAVKEHAESFDCHEPPGDEVSVWLREPPRLDAIAQRVHELIDGEGRSYRDAAKVLRGEGHNVNSGNVWYSYRRWNEMQGLPVPKRPYNNGHRRKLA